MADRGYTASQKLVGRLLRDLGFSLQANKKTLEGARHPDRDAQFEHINQKIKDFQSTSQPAISVDTKKKELVGDFKNGGRELRPKGRPQAVRVHDFQIPELGKVAPYGVYDLAANTGWVNLGIDHDTAAFAVESIRRWWRALGQKCYLGATGLLITADCGGSNGARVRLWKRELQVFANDNVIDVFYTGDEGGIICSLDIGGPQTQNANLVSITYLGFHRNTPLSARLTFTSAIELRSSSNRTPADTNFLPVMRLVRARNPMPFEFARVPGIG